MKPETAPFLWTRKNRTDGPLESTGKLTGPFARLERPNVPSPSTGPGPPPDRTRARDDLTLEDFSKGSILTQPAVPDVAPSMSKGAKQVPVTPRHSERIHPVHRHLRSAEGPGSPRGVPNSSQRCLPLKAGTPDFLFLGFDSAPATAPSQNAKGRN
ncbi:hypothetical protein AVEN_206066-1 [Araneus ventricosus]|uniref:Uncharacterized protein n=1 Tax=Araneus ventricosus TaxID=182803 RepID=A0A4Y2TEL9_ARAVE|nr:hypothetical protein AVEN_98117-1 [Araneus ventricosus]GBN97544.1 hypothetical protein AVEN_109805-1 [Araneus ventricosus]GBN97552.1 hypothetical protein AVEN_98262-1 [Araneus ventricosus]GBN97849.1 hypothetical protein AVEN_206066-1 [Araneus ventricosus]